MREIGVGSGVSAASFQMRSMIHHVYLLYPYMELPYANHPVTGYHGGFRSEQVTLQVTRALFILLFLCFAVVLRLVFD